MYSYIIDAISCPGCSFQGQIRLLQIYFFVIGSCASRNKAEYAYINGAKFQDLIIDIT